MHTTHLSMTKNMFVAKSICTMHCYVRLVEWGSRNLLLQVAFLQCEIKKVQEGRGRVSGSGGGDSAQVQEGRGRVSGSEWSGRQCTRVEGDWE